MDYLYENIGEDRFQELCQSLLSREFPQTQCFPVRQPDGGRDAIAYFPHSSTGKAFAMFQVKFVRKPQAEKEPHRWLESVIAGEVDKLKKLLPKGAKAYYLLTNVQGTAHLESGSIDRVNELLSTLPVPAYCWWRDDLNQRLDTQFDLKWVYPQLLTGTDMLRLILEQGLSEDRERRTNAIRAFIRAQHEEDKEVRFKQVELQNDLLTLFTDIPIGVKRGMSEQETYYLKHIARMRGFDEESELGYAATVLLDSSLRTFFKQIVLEGAPGQGKSTISQYICQVHRMFLLDDPAISGLPAQHKPNYRCIPIKVDLRDLASWLNKKDPFAADDSPHAPQYWAKSLEAFVAALIRHHSGGAEFSVSDLQAVIQPSSILLVLDGLDEVADLARRKEVIQEVTIGVARLREVSASLQVIITSRPTAFGPALGFNEKFFPHLELHSLSQTLILEYAEKWLTARRLKQSEAATVRKILRQKIEQRHLRDLTRNPMQLTILLSLIHTRGSSLPEKRTALYDGYVELFFNRESEKSEIVREHRDLLIDLHRHLAWVLHSEAEADQLRGSISSDRLQKVLKNYLSEEKRDDSSVADLFKGMVERIVFLVSRVEGTLEFEVQPLREYFVAKHLYDTSPYSPPGKEQRGTKPDRFDAIAQNPYWLNVTRFFAGCFSKGELPCIVDRLEFLAQKEKPNYSNRQRRLASFLLRDWVFSQDQRSMQRAVALVLDGAGLRHPQRRRRRAFPPLDEEMVLPPGCGRDELVTKCITTLKEKPNWDVAVETAQILCANSSNEITDGVWEREFNNAVDGEVTRWLRYGLHLGALARTESTKLGDKLKTRKVTLEQLQVLHSAGHTSLIISSEEYSKTLLNGILDDTVRGIRNAPDIFGKFSACLQATRYSFAYEHPVPNPLHEVIKHREEYNDLSTPIELPERNVVISKCAEFLINANREIARNAFEWATELDPWRNLIEAARASWGDRRSIFQLANVAAGAGINDSVSIEHLDLLDASKSLCDRVKYASTRSGASLWWQQQFQTAATEDQLLLVTLVFSSWAGTRTFVKLIDILNERLEAMSEENWSFLARSLQTVSRVTRTRRRERIQTASLPDQLGERTVFAVAARSDPQECQNLFLRYYMDYAGRDSSIVGYCLRNALVLVDERPSLWKNILTLLKGGQVSGGVRDPYNYFRGTRSISQAMPLEAARTIAAEQTSYPRAWVYAAIERCELDAVSKVETVAAIANQEGWFKR